LRAAAFPASTARSPVIGWRADLEHMGVAEVRSWYDDWYGPNNAALVVVGDVEPAAVRSMAQTYFGDKRAVELPRRRPTAELEPRGPQRLEVRVKAELPHIALAWCVPSLSTVGDRADAYALDVLAGILDGGRSARIPRRIVRGQALAANASASYTLVSRSDTLLTISATPAGERSVAELESALLDQVEVLKSGRVEASELERVKTNVRASDVFSRDSMFYQALRIGRLEMTGLGQDAYEDYLAGVADVTPADVQRVAQRYLVAERRTVAELVPQAIQSAQGEAGSTNGGQVGSEVSP
jgi:zinc protease